MKRAAVNLTIMLLVVIALVATRWEDWQADRERSRQQQALNRGEAAALVTIKESSPAPMPHLNAAGVTLTHGASRQGDTVRVDYVLTAAVPADAAHTYMRGTAPSPQLIDPATGKAVGRFTQGGNRVTPGQPVTGEAIFEAVGNLPAGALIQFPTLLVYRAPAQALRWEVKRPAVEADIPLGHRFTVAGVEFELERIRFGRRDAYIDYRQLTPQAQVGYHLLDFRLSDRMGGSWGAPDRPERLPDPAHPSHPFEFVASLSRDWVIRVEHAVLALPGPTVPLEVK